MPTETSRTTGAPRWPTSLGKRLAAAAAITVAFTGTLAMATPAQAASGLPALPLATQGSDIVDAKGKTVVLQGVNWFGFETANHAPHGLWRRDHRDMLKQIRAQGFNTIRMPFSLEMLESSTTSGIDYGSGRNAALKGKTPQQVMDIIIDEAGDQGLMVILDNHSQSDDGFMYDLWYGQGGYTENDWVQAWSTLASRYADEPQVIGADLKNEPHGSATWGAGGPTDWRRAAQRAGNAVLASNPELLILVEGIEAPVAGGKLDRHWWGGNLEGVRTNPVKLSATDKLVYSPHEYGPGVFAQPWFSDPNMATILKNRWDAGFGYIHDNDIAPLLVGEFGAKNVGLDTTEGRWIRQFADYLGAKGISWTFWSWNPNSGDTGGVLKDDWTTVHADKMGLLSDLMARQPMDFGGIVSPKVPTEPISSPDPSGTVGTDDLSLSVVTDSTWGSGWCGHLEVRNSGAVSAQVSSMTLRITSGQKVSSTWNGEASTSGTRVTIKAPAWANVPAGGRFADTGLCLSGSSAPKALGITIVGGEPVTIGDPRQQPEPAPAPVTPAPELPETPAIPEPGPGIDDPAPAADLAVTFRQDSSWEGGYCRTAVVTNTGDEASGPWHLIFRLPAEASMSTHWNGVISEAGGIFTVTPPSWADTIGAGNASSAFGFCVVGAGEPQDASAGVQ